MGLLVAKDSFAKIVFLLRAFFSGYVGLFFVHDNGYLIPLSVSTVALATANRRTPQFDLAFTSVVFPKGLGAAVLAILLV